MHKQKKEKKRIVSQAFDSSKLWAMVKRIVTNFYINLFYLPAFSKIWNMTIE